MSRCRWSSGFGEELLDRRGIVFASVAERKAVLAQHLAPEIGVADCVEGLVGREVMRVCDGRLCSCYCG